MRDLSVEVIKGEDIEMCRELCNELMAFQKTQAVIAPEAFNGMNFDTRMKTSYLSALEAFVALARDNGKPVGYVFSTIENVEKKAFEPPAWAPKIPGEEMLGFYPKWDNLPEKAGCVTNLYFRDEYRGRGLGRKFMDMSMEWFASFTDLDLVFIYISNGNKSALDFYLKYGFEYSHDVFGGFITAVYKRIGRGAVQA